MGTAVTVLSILGPTLITKAANRVVKIFEVLQKWEQTLNKQISKEPNALAPIFHFAWFPFTRQDELGTIILALLSLCFFGNFGPKWDREGTMDTRLEEVERRAEIIILTRHDIPLLAATMMSQWHNGQCSHNLGRASTIFLRLHFQDWIGLRRRMCFCKISQNCRIMHNIALLHYSAQYCPFAGSHNITQLLLCAMIHNGPLYFTFHNHNCRCNDMPLGTMLKAAQFSSNG